MLTDIFHLSFEERKAAIAKRIRFYPAEISNDELNNLAKIVSCLTSSPIIMENNSSKNTGYILLSMLSNKDNYYCITFYGFSKINNMLAIRYFDNNILISDMLNKDRIDKINSVL